MLETNEDIELTIMLALERHNHIKLNGITYGKLVHVKITDNGYDLYDDNQNVFNIQIDSILSSIIIEADIVIKCIEKVLKIS